MPGGADPARYFMQHELLALHFLHRSPLGNLRKTFSQ